MVVQKPATGFGPGAFLAVFQRFRPASYYNRAEVAPLSDHSHNEYLELASESGLPALFFFLTFLASVLALSIRKMKNGSVMAGPPAPEAHSPQARKTDAAISSEWFLSAGLISGLIAILVDGLSSTNLRTFSVVSIFWLLLGFCAAMITKTSDLRPQTSETKLKKNLKTSPISGLIFLPQVSFVWIAIMAFGIFSAIFIGREIKGQVYYKKGIAARDAGDWSVAITNYRKALEIDPANLQAAYKLGFVYATVNQTEDAINLYREILRISPNFAKTYYNLGVLYYLKMNDVNTAIVYLNQALKYDPYDNETQKFLDQLKNPTSKPRVIGNPSGIAK
jgi:tetratricopeptide (TPR) repeat protein